MKIKSFKMRTGEEITAEIVSRKNDEIRIKNPIMIMQVPNPNYGKQGHEQEPAQSTQMVGWFQTSCGEKKPINEIKEREFPLTKDMYFLEGEPMGYIKESYNNEFGKGIVIPPQNIVPAN